MKRYIFPVFYKITANIFIIGSLLLIAANTHARVDIACGLEGGATTSAVYNGDTQYSDQYSDALLAIPSFESCNQSLAFGATSLTEGATAEATAEISTYFSMVGNQYIFTASGKSSAAVTAKAPIGSESSAASAAAGVRSILHIYSDTPLRYQFSGDSYGLGGQDYGFNYADGIGYWPGPGSLGGFIGDPQGMSHPFGNSYNSTGYLTTLSFGWAGFDVSGQSDAGARLDGLAGVPLAELTEQGAAWTYRLFITPVPEPRIEWMLIAGGLFIFGWTRKFRISK